ncbi:bis(5'-nucleosyl)-tetraphosphatase (symmetrical) YqeK [Ornithinibacillus halophilus]|uniref:bis(5'-nucleosyl)-tetraphosphatase (symmetrical) n=1 Tax=Ornithinibacillus halophilus TaxID=930117 RepID=A0A1M5DK27_9BACI|nr:bis(5'-nucleosyl)-tetraphosphatase (symmetrical) YqeK [Ornithinibacillus halophilus]SHF67359.1 putative HD superfamily hydrolase of NAD metabolism [Ornithinibacillus halophilus]
MEIKEATTIVEKYLTKSRFEHTLRVAKTAKELAGKYGVDQEKAELAAIFHDYCKYRPLDEMRRIIEESYLPKDLLHFHHELWHGPVASLLIEREYGITDSSIKDAIFYHTTGRANMSDMELVLFVADYIEPGRDFPGLDEVRETAKKDLIHAAWLISRNTIRFLMDKGHTIYPDSFHSYNDLTKRVNGGN